MTIMGDAGQVGMLHLSWLSVLWHVSFAPMSVYTVGSFAGTGEFQDNGLQSLGRNL